jgi:hypothetical protein
MDALAAILGVLMPSVSFEGLTVAQWIAIASAIEAAAPEIKATIAALHPALAAIASDLAGGKSSDEAGAAAQVRNIPTEGGNPAVPR